MAVREFARSPAAVGCTVLGSLAVGVVAAAGWRLAVALRATGLTGHPVFLGGLSDLLFLLLVAVVGAASALVWYPFAAGVAYAFGRAPDDRVSLRRALRAVADRREPLYRWAKTRTVPGALADRLLGADDVRPNEVAIGCEKFVLPAIVTDAPELRAAVERANRVTPQAGRARLTGAALAATGALSLTVLGAGIVAGGSLDGPAALPAGTVTVAGVVVTAALDVAWRTEIYRDEDLSEGFVDAAPSRRDGPDRA